MLPPLTLLSMAAAEAKPSALNSASVHSPHHLPCGGMVQDTETQRLARRHGLSLVNVTWEDTGRSKGRPGPNISDMTIGVRDSRGRLHPMPVFRFDNFHDQTADIKAADICANG